MRSLVVYVVMRGENNEGGHVVAIFRKKEDAEAMATEIRQEKYFMSCDWCSVHEYIVK